MCARCIEPVCYFALRITTRQHRSAAVSGIGPADIRALVEGLAERGAYASNSNQCNTGTSSASAKCV